MGGLFGAAGFCTVFYRRGVRSEAPWTLRLDVDAAAISRAPFSSPAGEKENGKLFFQWVKFSHRKSCIPLENFLIKQEKKEKLKFTFWHGR